MDAPVIPSVVPREELTRRLLEEITTSMQRASALVGEEREAHLVSLCDVLQRDIPADVAAAVGLRHASR